MINSDKYTTLKLLTPYIIKLTNGDRLCGVYSSNLMLSGDRVLYRLTNAFYLEPKNNTLRRIKDSYKAILINHQHCISFAPIDDEEYLELKENKEMNDE